MKNIIKKISRFKIYGDGDQSIDNSIQPHIDLRGWDALNASEKLTALRALANDNWLQNQYIIVNTIKYLNKKYLRIAPGKNLHQNKYPFAEYQVALQDFAEIFRNESEAMVFKMLTVFAELHIDNHCYKLAEQADDEDMSHHYLQSAFHQFDRLIDCLNHIFEQFSVNYIFTRDGLVPKQDEKITQEIYVTTLKILSNPKWKDLNDDLAKVFNAYQDKNYDVVISQSYNAVYRFLKIISGEYDENGKGAFGKLFNNAINTGLIPSNSFTKPLLNNIERFISEERASSSGSKPILKEISPLDALLAMNLVMIFLQYCLTNKS